DLGTSILSSQPVLADLAAVLPSTIELMIFAAAIGLLIAVPAALWAAGRRGHAIAHGIRHTLPRSTRRAAGAGGSSGLVHTAHGGIDLVRERARAFGEQGDVLTHARHAAGTEAEHIDAHALQRERATLELAPRVGPPPDRIGHSAAVTLESRQSAHTLLAGGVVQRIRLRLERCDLALDAIGVVGARGAVEVD